MEKRPKSGSLGEGDPFLCGVDIFVLTVFVLNSFSPLLGCL